MNSFQLFPIIFILIGGGMATVSAVLLARKMRFTRGAVATTAVVTNVSRSESYDHESNRTTHLYQPSVRFQTRDGRTIDYTQPHATSWGNYQVGSAVPVMYNPLNPYEVSIGQASSVGFWLPLIFLLVVGLFFSGIGLALFMFTH